MGYYNNVMDNKIFSSTDFIYLTENINLNKGCVVAVGSFDGVHLGHKSMLDALVKEAESKKLPAAVFTFNTDDNPKNSKLIALSEKKYELLKNCGVDIVATAPFSALKNIEAESFAKDFLFEGMGAQSILCGYDFRFGKDRKGDCALIKGLLSQKGVNVITPDAYIYENKPVSSTLIRNLLTEGDIEKANRLLGRDFSFKGEIIHGAKLGRTLGFPTANQLYPNQLVQIPFGVYVVKIAFDGKIYSGVANFGVKPTVCDNCAPLCETYLFGYEGDCYGVNAEICFKRFIRPEKRFSSLDELKRQIQKDKETALNYFDKEYDL